MKSVMSRSVLGRRVIPGTVLALAAATLSLGVAGPASATQPIELQGTVTGANGAPLAGVTVSIFASADDSSPIVPTATTASDGTYSFNAVPAGDVKVEFEPNNSASFPVTASTPLPYQDRWSGGSRYFQGATVSHITVDPATPAVVNAALPQYASISGNIRVGATPHVATDLFGAWAQDTDENYVGSVELGGPEFVDGTTGNYRMIVDPSAPVRVAAYGADTAVNYLTQYWVDADTLAAATPISLAPGQNVSGINFWLTNALRTRQAPSISGYPTIGLPLTANHGTWTRNAATEFSYSWLRNGVQVGTGATYVPTVADYQQKLTLVVTALNGEFTGQSATTTSDVVKYGATERVAAKAKAGRKVSLAIKLVSAKQKPVRGKVVVLRGTKVVHQAVKLVKGKVVLVLKNQPKGRQTYTVHYKGNKVLAQVDKTVTVRVHK